MDEIKEILIRVMKDIEERKRKIKIPPYPERCKTCIDGEFIVENISFKCELYGDDRCPILRNFIKESVGEVFTSSVISKVQKGAREIVNEYIKNIRLMKKEGKGLNILGDIGTGKTSIVVIVIKELFRKKYPFDYFHAGEFFFNIDNSFRGKTFLFLDDLGVEYPSSYGRAFFDTLIDFRYRMNLPTIITSNLKEKELRRIYPRAMDRLFGRNIKVELKGVSKR